MITQIAMLPPTKPAPDPAPSAASTATSTADPANPAPTDSTTPTDFKQALHSARGKHKPAQPAQPAQASAKKSAAAAIKVKVVTPQPTDDEDADPAKPDVVSEEETAEASAKAATVTPTDIQSSKQAGKKNTSANTESETETTEPETPQISHQTKLVQPITPENPQPRGGKQQKSKEKAPQKTDVAPVEVNAAATLNSSIPSPHQIKTAPSSSNEPVVLPAAKGQNQQVIQPHASRNADSAATKTSDADSSVEVVATAPDTPTEQAEADADSSDATSAPAISSASAIPSAQAATVISTALNGLAAIAPTHSTESTVAPAAASPTRAFAEANQDQIVTTIKGQLLPDGGSMQITLHPDNLGHVHISVQVTGGSVSATFETSTDQATRLLSHSLSQLKQTLESAGVVVEKLQVTQTRDSQPQTQSDSRQSSQQPQTATDQRSAQQEKQRQEILQQMWDKIAGAKDWIDVKA